MKYIIITAIVVLVIISVKKAKEAEKNPEHPFKNNFRPEFSTNSEPDSPVGFGYKCMWLAVKTKDQNRVAEILRIYDFKEANWKSGIDSAYNNAIYITPPIDNWILAAGWGLPAGDSPEAIDRIKKLLVELSDVFGEAQYFLSHRVAECHCWMKATEGKVDRVYSYLGESGICLDVSGNPSEIEKDYDLFNSFSEAAKDENYYEKEGLVYPDEELVMKIAGNWSIDPTTLDDRDDIQGLGLIGVRK